MQAAIIKKPGDVIITGCLFPLALGLFQRVKTKVGDCIML